MYIDIYKHLCIQIENYILKLSRDIQMILPFLGLGNPLGLPGGLASGFLGRPWDRKTIGKPCGKLRKQ